MLLFRSVTKNPVFVSFLTGLFLILFAISIQFYFTYQSTPQKIKKDFETVLQRKELKLKDRLNTLQKSFERISLPDWIKISGDLQKMADEEGLAVFIYEKDSLIFWSANDIPLPDRWKDKNNAVNHEIRRLKNGWYEVVENTDSSRRYIGLILLKHEYPLENDFLENNFQKSFKVPYGTKISFTRGNVIINTTNGHQLM